MKKLVATIVLVGFAVGCSNLLTPTVDNYLHRGSSRYVILKKDAYLLDGPYRIVKKVSSVKIIAERNGVTYTVLVRGCRGFGGFYENEVMGSYLQDMGLYLLKDCSPILSSNEIKAIVYQPANRVYIGMPNGFDNLSYTMPQLLSIAYGELYVDHSDTNYPLYRTFCEAERLAKIHRKGYWATHTDPPATTTNAVSNVTTNK